MPPPHGPNEQTEPSRASDALLDELTRLHPRFMDLSLGRMLALLARLDHPERRLPPVVHVAGTNGKGSSTAYLRAMLEAAGKRVHVYTSPHLVRFHERIVLAEGPGRSAPIGEAALLEVLERTRRLNAGEPITQFEITTAAAFLAFAETSADALVLEVGLGGRLDATNVVEHPAATLITPISLDHADRLGATLGAIAGEKAGILKPGVPCVVSEQPEEAMRVIRERARRLGCRVTVYGEDYHVSAQGGRMVLQVEGLGHEARLLDLPLPGLIGAHQIVNAAGAVMVALGLDGREGRPDLGIDESAIARGITEARWPARMQRLDRGLLARQVGGETELWLDGGHNPAGGRAIAETVGRLEERSSKPLFLVLGMLANKDAAGYLEPFQGLVRGIVTVPMPGTHDRPFTAESLADLAVTLGFSAVDARGVEQALEAIEAVEPGPKRVLICGSLYLAGHVLALDGSV